MGAEGRSLSAPQHQNHTLTPRTPSSAVSSFNLPAQYDSTLVTPTNPTQSEVNMKSNGSQLDKSNDLRHLPSIYSQAYLEDDYSYRPREMKKHKDYYTNGGLNISTNDDDFDASPMICTSPYLGAFAASAMPQSAGGSYTSSSMQPSPQLVSAGGMSNGSRSSGPQTPALTPSTYRPLASHTPQLIAPNPATYRSSSNRVSPPHSRGSLGSLHSPPRNNSLSSTPGSSSNRVEKKKPKKKCSNEYIFSMLMEQKNVLSDEDYFVIHGKVVENLSWKELTARFNKRFKANMNKPALEMRKNRIGVRYKNQLQSSQLSSSDFKPEFKPEYKQEFKQEDRDRYGSEDSYEEYQYVGSAWPGFDPFQPSHVEYDSRSWSDISSPSLPDEESARVYTALTLNPMRLAPNSYGQSYHSPRLPGHDRMTYSPQHNQNDEWQARQLPRR